MFAVVNLGEIDAATLAGADVEVEADGGGCHVIAADAEGCRGQRSASAAAAGMAPASA